jgi:hypothetical protein
MGPISSVASGAHWHEADRYTVAVCDLGMHSICFGPCAYLDRSEVEAVPMRVTMAENTGDCMENGSEAVCGRIGATCEAGDMAEGCRTVVSSAGFAPGRRDRIPDTKPSGPFSSDGDPRRQARSN